MRWWFVKGCLNGRGHLKIVYASHFLLHGAPNIYDYMGNALVL